MPAPPTHFSAMPGVAGSYAAILFRRRRGLRDPAGLVQASVAVEPVAVDPAHLARYAALVGIEGTIAALPPLYLQLVASPMHLALLAAPTFPWPALGVVHLRNRVVQSCPVPPGARVRLEAGVRAARAVEQGMEFEIETVASVDGQEVWRSGIVALRRQKHGSDVQTVARAAAREPLGVSGASVAVAVPESMGRRYAAVAGDWNPIHQRAFLARFFGFPRAIVHGTWTLARALSLAPEPLGDAFAVDATFRRPVMLPSQISVRWGQSATGLEGTVRSGDGQTLHATVQVTRPA